MFKCVNLVVLGFFSLLSVPLSVAQDKTADQLFIERSSLRAADEHCELLLPGESLALDMGFWQARTALLRSGFSVSNVQAMEDEAADYAQRKPCDDEAMLNAAARLRDAFTAFARTPFMEFPGHTQSWTSTRTLTDVWGVSQQAYNNDTNTYPGPVRLGLAFPDRLRAPLSLADPSKPRETPIFAAMLHLPPDLPLPSSAQLVLRDPKRAQSPWLSSIFGSHHAAPRPPPNAYSRRIFAADRFMVDAPPYGDEEATPGVLFVFSEDAEAAFAALDPREAVRLEFVPSDRDRSTQKLSVTMEVGDFRAARAFSAIPRRVSPAAGEPEG